MSNRSKAARGLSRDKRGGGIAAGAKRPAGGPAASAPAFAPAPGAPGARFDVLSDVMEQVRLEGTVYFTAELHAPWGIAVERKGRAPFYVVTEGSCELRLLPRGPLHVLRAGDLALLPNGAPHLARSDRGAPVLPFDAWLAAHPLDARFRAAQPGSGRVTRVTGGFFSSDAAQINPLLAALPPLIVLRGDDPQVQRWLAPTLAFIDAEIAQDHQGARTVLSRLADVLFIQALRAHAARDDELASWVRGLADPRIARALALLHEHYAQPWTLETLAQAAGLSRTLLAVRFRALVGESPISYLTRWRITRAANRLRSEAIDLDRLAEGVGYASAAVFAKAFRRVTGLSPGRWRRTNFAPPLAAAARSG